MVHEGPARVFDCEEDAIAAIKGGKIVPGDVVVIRYEGPKGGPGMREMLNPTSAIAGMGLGSSVALITDGILYGPAFGFIVNWISDILGQIILMQFLHKLYDIKHMSNSKIYKLLTTQKYPMVALTIGYLIPFIPSATVSYVNILINKNDFKKQLIPIVIGVSPFAYLYAYGGDSILHLDTSRIIKAAVMIVAVALIAAAILFIMKRVKKHTKKA